MENPLTELEIARQVCKRKLADIVATLPHLARKSESLQDYNNSEKKKKLDEKDIEIKEWTGKLNAINEKMYEMVQTMTLLN